MGIPLGSNFNMSAAIPLDSRQVVADLTARDAIVAGIRWQGMQVFVVGTQTTYILKTGITNSDWVIFGGEVPNTNGTNVDGTVSTVATLTKPANAVGFILTNLDTSAASIRWKIGSAATASSGQQLQPGRDTGYIPVGSDVSICAESGTQNYNIQWVQSV